MSQEVNMQEVNKEIKNIIDSEPDLKMRKFLRECVKLEWKRYKTQYSRYSEKYDELIEKCVKWKNAN